MEEAKNLSRRRHIVMLPFMAQGHLIPFLALAKKLHKRFNFAVTIASTPLNIRYLKNTIEKSSTSLSEIHLSELPFNSLDHGLPPDTENTESVPLKRMIDLFYASTHLEIPFRRLIEDITTGEGCPPLCIISDIFAGWANSVAKEYRTVNVAFTTGGAYGTAAYASLWRHLPHRQIEQDEFRVPGFPDTCVFHITQIHHFMRVADGSDRWSRFFQTQIGYSMDSLGLLCNTAVEIEPLGLEALKNCTNLPVWCIGPLIPPRMLTSKSGLIGAHTGREPGVSPEKCLNWLDSHPEKSVLYISFGSQNTISTTQMISLAIGLEDSQKPFIWVIRPPVGFDLRGEFKSEWLPEGFEERTARDNRGLLVRGWASQLEILRHRSTAAFLSHCGWNSTMESLSQGVPMIGWPLAAEQGYNAKMLVEEMGVCVEIARGVESGISVEHVKNVIEIVMGSEEMRQKARNVGELIRSAAAEEEGEDGKGKGSSYKAMDDFVSAIARISELCAH